MGSSSHLLLVGRVLLLEYESLLKGPELSKRTVEGDCNRCQAVRPIYTPVSWQDDVCATCESSGAELGA